MLRSVNGCTCVSHLFYSGYFPVGKKDMMILVVYHSFVDHHVTLSISSPNWSICRRENARREVRTKYTQVTTTWGHPWQPDLTNITKNIYIFSLSDPKMFMAQEVQPQTTTTLGVVLLVIQLISLALLMPMALVLVSFYRRVSRQRRRDNTHSVMINVPVTNDEHSLDNQTSPLTTATFDDAGNGEDTCRV